MTDFASLLVTTDFSNQSLPALQVAADLAKRLDARITLMHVVLDHLPPIIPLALEVDRRPILKEYGARAEERLESLVAEFFDGIAIKTHTTTGVVWEEIIRCAEENGDDLIVIASRGYGPIRQLAMGSTSERVLHHATCPVLVVPSKD